MKKNNIYNMMTDLVRSTWRKGAGVLMLIAAIVGLSVSSCSEDDLSTNQYGGGVKLNVFGPSPVMRGGTLRFIGSNLDQVAQVVIPGCDPITNIEVVKAGVPSEIRITVPKDGPEEGIITLITKTDQQIKTVTPVAYEEPIEFETFTPESVMPGDIITIKGDYLNLIHAVGFADGVIVSEKDFVLEEGEERSRYEIKVIVPEAARTGKISLYDLDITDPEIESGVSYNIITSETALIVGTPTIEKFASPRGEAKPQGKVIAKMNETLTITGKDFKLIKAITFGEGDYIVESEDIKISEDGKTITTNLPAEAPDGPINLVCLSGIEIPVGTIETVKPSELQVPQSVKNGAELVIIGKDMDVITGVAFPNVADVVVGKGTATSYTVTVPEAAQEGNLALCMANGASVIVSYNLVKPIVTEYKSSPVSAGAALSIVGQDLDLVKSVTFLDSETDVEVTAENDGTLITLTVPMDSKSGKPTLNLKNGTKVVAPEISIEEAVFCYAVQLPSEEEELKAGETMTIPVKNKEVLTKVQINGNDCQYILTGNNLIIGIPETATKNSTLKLISSNGEIEYSIAVKPASEVSLVIWKGMTDITWSAGGRVCVPAKYFENVPAGAKLTLHYTQKDGVWAQAQINNGKWKAIKFAEYPNDKDVLIPTDIYGWFSDGILARETELTLTQDIIDNILANRNDDNDDNAKDCGLIIQGGGLVFTKITLSYTIPTETTIWQGDITLTWSKGGRVCVPATPFETAKPGSILRFYYDNYDLTKWGCFQINDGAWKGINFTEGENIFNQQFCPNDVHGWSGILKEGVLSVKLTKDVISQILERRGDDDDDNAKDCGIIVQGSGPHVYKVTIE